LEESYGEGFFFRNRHTRKRPTLCKIRTLLRLLGKKKKGLGVLERWSIARSEGGVENYGVFSFVQNDEATVLDMRTNTTLNLNPSGTNKWAQEPQKTGAPKQKGKIVSFKRILNTSLHRSNTIL